MSSKKKSTINKKTTTSTTTSSSTPTTQSEKSTSSKTSPKSNNSRHSDDDSDDDDGLRLTNEEFALSKWFETRPPDTKKGHYDAFSLLTDRKWEWTEICKKPLENEFYPLFDRLYALKVLGMKEMGKFLIYYFQDHSGLVTMVSEISSSYGVVPQIIERITLQKEQLIQVAVGRENTERRQNLVLEETNLISKIELVNKEIDENRAFDPEIIADFEDHIEDATKGANNVTDSIFSAYSFYKNRDWTEETSTEFYKRYQLSDDFDELPRFIRKTPQGRVKTILDGKHVTLVKRKK